MADPERVTASFLDAVKAIAEQGMKTMPCLFNRWHDSRWDYGGTYTETLFRDWKPQLDYVRALVTPLVGDDRVLIWDLCNEPQAHDQSSEVNKKEFTWLKCIAETVRGCGAKQPITIGTMGTSTTSGNVPRRSSTSSAPGPDTPRWLRAAADRGSPSRRFATGDSRGRRQRQFGGE